MTRENKAGLAVCGAFLCLAGTVAFLKWQAPAAAGDAAPNSPTLAMASEPAPATDKSDPAPPVVAPAPPTTPPEPEKKAAEPIPAAAPRRSQRRPPGRICRPCRRPLHRPSCPHPITAPPPPPSPARTTLPTCAAGRFQQFAAGQLAAGEYAAAGRRRKP